MKTAFSFRFQDTGIRASNSIVLVLQSNHDRDDDVVVGEVLLVELKPDVTLSLQLRFRVCALTLRNALDPNTPAINLDS
jgi:hypothetical protein